MTLKEAILHKSVITNKETQGVPKETPGEIVKVERPDGTVGVHFVKHGTRYCDPADLDEHAQKPIQPKFWL